MKLSPKRFLAFCFAGVLACTSVMAWGAVHHRKAVDVSR